MAQNLILKNPFTLFFPIILLNESVSKGKNVEKWKKKKKREMEQRNVLPL